MTIRETISYAIHLRRDLARKPSHVLIADSLVGDLLGKCIAYLKALDIPPRLHAERVAREAELGACEDLQRWWLKQRGQSAPLERVTATLVSPDGTRLEAGEGVHIPSEGLDLGAKPEPGERLYGRGRVVLRVIDGGKK